MHRKGHIENSTYQSSPNGWKNECFIQQNAHNIPLSGITRPVLGSARTGRPGPRATGSAQPRSRFGRQGRPMFGSSGARHAGPRQIGPSDEALLEAAKMMAKKREKEAGIEPQQDEAEKGNAPTFQIPKSLKKFVINYYGKLSLSECPREELPLWIFARMPDYFSPDMLPPSSIQDDQPQSLRRHGKPPTSQPLVMIPYPPKDHSLLIIPNPSLDVLASAGRGGGRGGVPGTLGGMPTRPSAHFTQRPQMQFSRPTMSGIPQRLPRTPGQSQPSTGAPTSSTALARGPSAIQSQIPRATTSTNQPSENDATDQPSENAATNQPPQTTGPTRPDAPSSGNLLARGLYGIRSQIRRATTSTNQPSENTTTDQPRPQTPGQTRPSNAVPSSGNALARGLSGIRSQIVRATTSTNQPPGNTATNQPFENAATDQPHHQPENEQLQQFENFVEAPQHEIVQQPIIGDICTTCNQKIKPKKEHKEEKEKNEPDVCRYEEFEQFFKESEKNLLDTLKLQEKFLKDVDTSYVLKLIDRYNHEVRPYSLLSNLHPFHCKKFRHR